MHTGPIAIVGTGRLAQALGRALVVNGEPVAVAAGRDVERARNAASFIGPGVSGAALGEVPRLARRLIIATADDRLPAVVDLLAGAGFADGVALHTCGARGIDVLAPLGPHVSRGVLHPLQTIPDPARATFAGVSFGVAGDAPAVAWASAVARLVGGRPVMVAAEHLPRYHAAAVLAANGVPALLDAAITLMMQSGLSEASARDALAPLVRTAVDASLALGPQAALTGPVARGDVSTIRAHVAALRTAPGDVAPLYAAVSRQLLDVAARRGLAAEARAAIMSTLNAAH